jgi:hypothetical protein
MAMPTGSTYPHKALVLPEIWRKSRTGKVNFAALAYPGYGIRKSVYSMKYAFSMNMILPEWLSPQAFCLHAAKFEGHFYLNVLPGGCNNLLNGFKQ